MIFAMIIEGEDHGLDLLVWVELRGFEPLTPRCEHSPLHPPTSLDRNRPVQRLLLNPVRSSSGRVIQKMISQIPPS
jgi:hypothetical protein